VTMGAYAGTGKTAFPGTVFSFQFWMLGRAT
jgi:hypothetical protein